MTNTNDSGAGSLRQAIIDANTNNNDPAVDCIAFNISGNGPHTISPTSALPSIGEPPTINGYTQGDTTATTTDDATENTQAQGTDAVLKIQLSGTSTTNEFGLLIDASNAVIRRMVVNNFDAAGILIGSGTGHRIEGNFIGTDPSGTTAQPNDNSGVAVSDQPKDSTIGGTAPAARNLLSGNTDDGVEFSGSGSTGIKIQGNLIGTQKDGT